MPVGTARMVTLKIEDGTGTPLSLTLGPYKGYPKISKIVNGGKEAIDIDDRGDFLERIFGKETDIEISCELFHDGDLTDATTKTIIDAVLRQGAWAAAVSKDTNAGTGGPMAYKATITYTRSAPTSITNTFVLDIAVVEVDYQTALEGNSIPVTIRGRGGDLTVT